MAVIQFTDLSVTQIC